MYSPERNKKREIINALSIDLEEYYHAEFAKSASRRKKLLGPSAGLLLDHLARYKTKATFFIVGELVKDNPETVKRIYREGHEIALHGFSHSRMHDLCPDRLRSEITQSKRALEEVLQVKLEIKGFRCPSFSLDPETSWALDVLKEFNFKYDSSVFPFKNFFYGVNGAPCDIYGINSQNIKVPDDTSPLKEFPITAIKFFGLNLPVTGGFFLRALPIFMQIKALKIVNKTRPFVLYIHPWECLAETPRVKMSPLHGFIMYHNIKYSLKKLETLLKNFKFDRIDNVLGL